MKNKIYLTKQGLLEVQAELGYLIKVRRPELVQLFKEAQLTKNLSESGECNYIRSEQALVEKKIRELEVLAKDARVVEDIDTSRVSIGTRARLKFLANDEEKTYTIVGTHEANPLENKISNESPIVQAILGKKVNDTVTVVFRLNKFQVRILDISIQQ
jgi:transcription elongation factor GreA